MDSFEKQLKQDADAIEVVVSPALEARIAASLNAVGSPARGRSRRVRSGLRWWTYSTLTGAAAVLMVVVAVNRPDGADGRAGAVVVDTEVRERTVPGSGPAGTRADGQPLFAPLDIRTAEFADPLSRELEAVKSDLEKARSEVEDDLRFTF